MTEAEAILELSKLVEQLARTTTQQEKRSMKIIQLLARTVSAMELLARNVELLETRVGLLEGRVSQNS